MAWNPFKRRGREAPEQQPAAPAGQAPAESPAPKRGGLFGRMFGRGKPKPGKPAAPAGKAPAPSGAPGTGPAGAAPAAPEGGGGGDGGEGGGEAPAKEYPKTLHVEGDGTWKISKTKWHGKASGTLTGSTVKSFLDAMEAGDTKSCLELIAVAYDDGSGFAEMLDPEGCQVDISYG